MFRWLGIPSQKVVGSLGIGCRQCRRIIDFDLFLYGCGLRIKNFRHAGATRPVSHDQCPKWNCIVGVYGCRFMFSFLINNDSFLLQTVSFVKSKITSERLNHRRL